ncbi:hypothetical protein BUZ41_00595 [Staphylococcus haemolyticus]|uniref:hypothetical protein n=2 Tax=Staphylococcus haemolyticus TaxID=1283 RepID=UPI000D1D845A|nr:hypothetical protein [Staphylococcus haemolyticus]PTL05558.1 hypothetical protein BUZ41_00595 [Staphylococcus haemolyticus]
MKANKVYRSHGKTYIFTEEQLNKAVENDISENAIINRMYHGWEIEDIINKPIRNITRSGGMSVEPRIAKMREERRKKRERKNMKVNIINQKRTYPRVTKSSYYYDLLNHATKHLKAGG